MMEHKPITSADKLARLIRNICIHIINSKPKFIDVKHMPISHLKVEASKERDSIEREMLAIGKDVYNEDKKEVEEKVEMFKKKYLENYVLEEQPYMIDEKMLVKDVISNHRIVNDV